MDNSLKTKLQNINLLSTPIFLSKNIVNPRRDWIILISIFIALIILSLGFDFYMYQKIISGGMYISVNKEELVVENLKHNELKNILDNFESKKTKTAELKLDNLVDPSI